MIEPYLHELALAAANKSPIFSGTTYTYNNATGVVTPTYAVGDHASIAAGDVLVDISTGASALISAGGVATFTVQSGLSALFDGADFEVHRLPSNVTGSRNLGGGFDHPPKTLYWRCRRVGTGAQTATFQWYVWLPSVRRWSIVGSTVTVTLPFAGAEVEIIGEAKRRGPLGEGTLYTYNNVTGAISAITFSGGFAAANVSAGMLIVDSTTKVGASITAVDPAGTLYAAAGLSASLDGGAFAIVAGGGVPADCCVYPYVSAIAGAPKYVNALSRVLFE